MEKNIQAKLQSSVWRISLLLTSLSLGLMSVGVIAFAGLTAETAAAQDSVTTGAAEISMANEGVQSRETPMSAEAMETEQMLVRSRTPRSIPF